MCGRRRVLPRSHHGLPTEMLYLRTWGSCQAPDVRYGRQHVGHSDYPLRTRFLRVFVLRTSRRLDADLQKPSNPVIVGRRPFPSAVPTRSGRARRERACRPTGALRVDGPPLARTETRSEAEPRRMRSDAAKCPSRVGLTERRKEVPPDDYGFLRGFRGVQIGNVSLNVWPFPAFWV